MFLSPEIVFNLYFCEVFIGPEGEILRHLVLIGEVEETDRPLRIAIEPCNYVSLHLLDRLSISSVICIRVNPSLEIELMTSLHFLESTAHASVSRCDD